MPYRQKHEKATASLQSFIAATPWNVGMRPPPLRLEKFRAHWREKYRSIVDVIPTSERAIRESLQREANALPPCGFVSVGEKKKDEKKIGARDAAIWLTAVEYAREHVDEMVYFVSANTSDFGDGTSYSYPMNEDLEGIAERFVLLTSLGEVVKLFASETDVDIDQVAQAVQRPESFTAASETARRAMDHRRGHYAPFECTAVPLGPDGVRVGDPAPTIALGWISGPTVQFVSLEETEAYRIGGHEWCMATVRWRLGGLVRLSEGTLPYGRAGCAWDTRVLLSTTQHDSPLNVLRSMATKPLSAEEFERLPSPPAPRNLNGPFDFTARPVSDVLAAMTLSDTTLTKLERHIRLLSEQAYLLPRYTDTDSEE